MPRVGGALGQPLKDTEGFLAVPLDSAESDGGCERVREGCRACRARCCGESGCGCGDDAESGVVCRAVQGCARRCVMSGHKGFDDAGCRCGVACSTACNMVLTLTLLLVVTALHRAIVPPPGFTRCLGGVAKTYTVKDGDSCAQISADQHVPLFDVVDHNKSRSCCEDSEINKGDVIELCNVPSQAGWHGRGLPREKLVMTYLGGIGYINGVEYPAPLELPRSVNIAALAFAEDSDGRGHFEMDVQAGCTQPDCKPRQGKGFDADCATRVDPSSRERGYNELLRMADKERRWLVSIVPRTGNEWPYETDAAVWGLNAATSLKQIILRYRLDGIDVDFEARNANHTIFTTAMCSLFENLKHQLPGAIVSAAFYGNPEYPDNKEQSQTIPLYRELKAKCDALIDFYNYQNYANWIEGGSTGKNFQHVKTMGKEFGWEKFVWGVGVGGVPNHPADKWKWWPSNPGKFGPDIMQALLDYNHEDGKDTLGKYPKDMRGAFTWAGEFSVMCKPHSWCIEDQFRRQLVMPELGLPNLECSCPDGSK